MTGGQLPRPGTEEVPGGTDRRPRGTGPAHSRRAAGSAGREGGSGAGPGHGNGDGRGGGGREEPRPLWRNRDWTLLWCGQALSVLGTRTSAVGTGLVLGCFGVGGLAGSLALPRAALRLSPRAAAVGGTWLWAVLLVPPAAVSAPWQPAAVTAAPAFVGPVWNVVVTGYRYRVVPAPLLGRVKSVVLLVSWGAMPFGRLLAGALPGLTDPRGTVVVLAVLAPGVALPATLAPGVRRPEPAAA
ncbi:hypothetical protein [Streptomyces sp. NPDC021224]|uniref:hypothetical protein n=1 Tax=unclassified Streptomyces TaxID=2593676 RepID=UPI0037A368FE